MHGQSGVDLQPSGRSTAARRRSRGAGPVTADDPGLPGARGALVETHGRVDPLRPSGVLGAQVLVELQQRPALQDLRRRDVALGQPPARRAVPEQLRVGLVGLGAPLGPRADGSPPARPVRGDAGLGHFFGDVPPAGAAFHRERHRPPGWNRGQPVGQVFAVGRGDLAAFPLARSARRPSRMSAASGGCPGRLRSTSGPPQAPEGARSARTRMPTQLIVTCLS